MVAVVGLQEELNLLGQKGEKLAGSLRDHEVVRNSDLALGKAESAVAVQLNGANTEVGATQVDSHVKTLLSTVGHSGHIGRDLAHGLSLALQTLVHLADEFLDGAVDIILLVLKLSGNALGGLCERHTAR